MSETQATRQIQRGWMPYSLAAEQYIGIAPSVLLSAIRNKQLEAFEKPLTRGRTAKDPKKERKQYFVCLADVDTYIRTYWKSNLVD